MAHSLVIVESPGKISKIQSILGDGYVVMASVGHILDLPSKTIGVDLEHNYEPTYQTIEGKENVIRNLQSTNRKVANCLLAADMDREGEMIAWSVARVLNLTDPKRIVFQSITKQALKQALENPRTIDQKMVEAQKSRRILDRMFGYLISPLLWKEMGASRLSAGRVQSVVVRLLVEKEREIKGYLEKGGENYCTVSACFLDKNDKAFETKLYGPSTGAGPSVDADPDAEGEDGEAEAEAGPAGEAKLVRWTESRVKPFLDAHKSYVERYEVLSVEDKETTRNPPPPFTTSTLQQAASRVLKFPVKKTMEVAQKLYESGKITYMRTDCTELSKEAVEGAKKYIEEKYGKGYSTPRTYPSKSKETQNAHEAIRPTHIEDTNGGEGDQKKLYDLIWHQTVQSQMSASKSVQRTVRVSSPLDAHFFQTTEQVVVFDGYLRLEGRALQTEFSIELSEENRRLAPQTVQVAQTWKKPPSRFDEATLVRQLDPSHMNIGRPSTYSSIIDKIQKAGYVEIQNIEPISKDLKEWVWDRKDGKVKEKKKKSKVAGEKGRMVPTELGYRVTDYLVRTFPTLFEYAFTSQMEHQLDQIVEGTMVWTQVLDEVYRVLKAAMEAVQISTGAIGFQPRVLGETLDGKRLSVIRSKFGFALVCDDGVKKSFVSLKEDEAKTLTIEQGVKLLLPSSEGAEYQGKPMVLKKGPYGMYVQWSGKNYGVPEGSEPTEWARIIALKEWRAEDADWYYSYGEGKYGPYIKCIFRTTGEVSFVQWAGKEEPTLQGAQSALLQKLKRGK